MNYDFIPGNKPEKLSLVEKAVAEAEHKICLLFSRGEHLRVSTEIIIFNDFHVPSREEWTALTGSLQELQQSEKYKHSLLQSPHSPLPSLDNKRP